MSRQDYHYYQILASRMAGWCPHGLVEVDLRVEADYDPTKKKDPTSINGIISFLEDPGYVGDTNMPIVGSPAPFDVTIYDSITFGGAVALEFGRVRLKVLGIELHEDRSGPVSFDDEHYRIGYTFTA